MENRLFLIDLIRQASDQFLKDNVFLERLAQNELSDKEWHKFAIQRWLSAQSFEPLLQTAIEAAKKLNKAELSAVLSSNLADEVSHATWRQDFYTAIGITNKDLNTHQQSAASHYINTIEELMSDNDALVLAGALLALEAIIPREFAKIKISRDKKWPSLPAKAKLYIDDHIVHDAQSHYPDLLNALAPLLDDEASRQKVKYGIETVSQAKKSFYNLLTSTPDDEK